MSGHAVLAGARRVGLGGVRGMGMLLELELESGSAGEVVLIVLLRRRL